MSDLNCPYCYADIEVCHDDGFGYEEDEAHEMECDECEKNFVFYTSITYYYEPRKADCLNGAEHNLKFSLAYPKKFSKMRCQDCDYSESWPPKTGLAKANSD